MASISWSHRTEDSWVVAGWAFRQLIEDVLTCHVHDAEIQTELADVSDLKYLCIESSDPELGINLFYAVRDIAAGILSGSFQSSLANKAYGTAHTVSEYQKGLNDLVGEMSKYDPAPIAEDRALLPSEISAIEWLIEHAQTKAHFELQIEQTRVVGRCPSGCSTIDLGTPSWRRAHSDTSQVLSEVSGFTQQKASVWVQLWSTGSHLSRLSVHELNGRPMTLSRTVLSTITPYGKRESLLSRLNPFRSRS